jgi:hypothetical protein
MSALQNMILDELLDMIEVARLRHGSVVISIWQFLPYNLVRFTESEKLLHV